MKLRKVLAVVFALALVLSTAGAVKVSAAVDGAVLLSSNGAVDKSVLAAAPEGSTLVAEYLWAESASADHYWGIGGVCFGGWTVDPAFEVTIPAEANRGDTLTAEFAVADVLAAAGDQDINWNFYNGIETYTLYLVSPAAEEPILIAPAPTLPQTGVVSSIVLMLAGAALTGAGVVTVKKNREK